MLSLKEIDFIYKIYQSLWNKKQKTERFEFSYFFGYIFASFRAQNLRLYWFVFKFSYHTMRTVFIAMKTCNKLIRFVFDVSSHTLHEFHFNSDCCSATCHEKRERCWSSFVFIECELNNTNFQFFVVSDQMEFEWGFCSSVSSGNFFFSKWLIIRHEVIWEIENARRWLWH